MWRRSLANERVSLGSLLLQYCVMLTHIIIVMMMMTMMNSESFQLEKVDPVCYSTCEPFEESLRV